MKSNRWLLRNGRGVLLIIVAFLLFGVSSAFALPLTNTVITWDTPAYEGWYSVYTFNADQLPGPLDAFCVDPMHAVSGADYELVAVPERLDLVAKMADHFFTFGGTTDAFGTQSDYQISIWKTLNMKDYTLGLVGVDAVLNNISFFQDDYTIKGAIALALSGESQDYLVAAPVPEPATMLLLGTGLIGLAGASRKKFRK